MQPYSKCHWMLRAASDLITQSITKTEKAAIRRSRERHLGGCKRSSGWILANYRLKMTLRVRIRDLTLRLEGMDPEPAWARTLSLVRECEVLLECMERCPHFTPEERTAVLALSGVV